MSWIVIGYYTKDTIYESHASQLVQSIRTFNLSYEVLPIEDLGSWDVATHYKPTFIKQMLQKHHPKSVVYVDVDATFLAYPALFDELELMPNVDVAACLLDHSKYKRKNCAPEILSGTLYFKNNDRSGIIIDRWNDECTKNLKLWDQAALAKVLADVGYYPLPDRYCMIFDYMSTVPNPIIKHFQASRSARAAERLKKKPIAVKSGVIKIHRS